MPKLLIDFLAAVTLAVLWGSIAQTQFNLAALAGLGADIGLGLRLSTTWQDLLGFAPLYAAIVVAALIPALFASALVARLLPRLRLAVFALGAAAGWLLAIQLVNALAPMPTLIAATRGIGGLLTLAIGIGFAGLLFAALRTPSERRSVPQP